MTSRFFVYNILLIFIIFISLVFVVIQNFVIIQGNILTGKTIEESAVSNVSINKYLAISFSGNLSEGIFFGSIYSLPALNINATQNYGGSINGTEYYINVSTDSNSNVDFCIKASGNMQNLASDAIGLDNETYSHYDLTNSSVPEISSDTPLTISYVQSGSNIPIGGANYYRFWLDIPAGQPSGDYNNTISFKGVEYGTSC